MNLPNALLADIASVLGDSHSHSQIDNMFIRLGAPGEPPGGNKVDKTYEWLRRATGDPDCDEVRLLGGVLEELMDRETYYNTEVVEERRAKVRRALAKHGLSYQQGG